MSRKVLIDCDPGIDDAVALCMALFDPRLDVLAITATEGNVSAEMTSRNVQAIVEQLDPPRYPRLGIASPLDTAPITDAKLMHGNTGLGDWESNVSMLHHQHPADKVICDVVRDNQDQVTILALGPLTNVARSLTRAPDIGPMIGQIIMMGGSVQGIGNVSPAAEFNIHYDPEAARTVFNSATTKTLVPLDVTRQVVASLSFLDQLPPESTRAGSFLHRIIPHLFRAYRQRLGLECIHIHDAVALVAVLQPELFEMEPMHGDVETQGELTRGATVFDRRAAPDGRPNMDVAVGLDAAAVMDSILRGLMRAGEQSRQES